MLWQIVKSIWLSFLGIWWFQSRPLNFKFRQQELAYKSILLSEFNRSPTHSIYLLPKDLLHVNLMKTFEKWEAQNLQHKLEEDNRIILDLCMSLRCFEGLLNHAASDSPQNTISGAGVLLNATMANFWKDCLAVNIRTMDEYSSALQMTLATRKEFRDQKKTSLFWKWKALDSNKFQSVITPSVSSISSVHDPLPLDHQIALDALISRRGVT